MRSAWGRVHAHHSTWPVTVQETRARWNSMESIMQFGWSGSAVLGGLIIDHSTYSVSFLTTAAVQASSILVRPKQPQPAASHSLQGCHSDCQVANAKLSRRAGHLYVQSRLTSY